MNASPAGVMRCGRESLIDNIPSPRVHSDQNKMINSCLLVIAAFGISLFLHVISYRFFRRQHISSILSVWSYTIGLTTLLIATASGTLLYPITWMMVYCSASICISWLSFAGFLGGVTPSSTMLAAYKKHHALSNQQLFHLFTSESFVAKRVKDLCRSKLVIKRQEILYLTEKGKLVATVINRYQYIFNRKERG